MSQEGKIEIIPSNPGWPAAFEAEALRLRTALEALALRSTITARRRFRGLAPSRCIDIQVSVAALRPLSTLGVRLAAKTVVSRPLSTSRTATLTLARLWSGGSMMPESPYELRAFASGTLIRSRVMSRPVNSPLPARQWVRCHRRFAAFASFSPTDARNPGTWIPVVAQATHPSMPHCPPPPHCDPTEDILVAPLEPGIADVGLVFSNVRRPTSSQPCSRRRACSRIRRCTHDDRGIRHHGTCRQGVAVDVWRMGRQPADQGLGRAEDRG